jgi:O-antigen ligase
MSANPAKALLILSAAALFVAGMLFLRPDYLASTSGLSVLIGAEILLAAIANYRKTFFPVILVCFLVAGADLPFRFAFLQGRWVVLAVGAVVGLAIYIKAETHTFGIFHLVAFFCVLSAFVSALVSAFPEESLLKALSLFLLFLYGAGGARSAVLLRPERFFAALVSGIEVLLWASVVFYLFLRVEIFGNPNSLGAIMGVAIVPVLLWGFLTAQSRGRKLRLQVELVLAMLLLLSSFARAAIGAAAISCLLICFSARQYRLLLKGVALTCLLAVCVILFVPQHTDGPSWDGSSSMSSVFLYKGKRERGFFGSRKGVWQQTWDAIRDKPWFGSGFGTSAITQDMTKLEYAEHHIDTWVAREHGNSYLAIAEWTGLLGVLPFYALVLLACRNLRSVFAWVRRTQDIFSPALPAAAIVSAGLFDAMFEDWLFAVGYYLCVFFWAMAFILVDVRPRAAVVYSPELVMPLPDQSYASVMPTR